MRSRFILAGLLLPAALAVGAEPAKLTGAKKPARLTGATPAVPPKAEPGAEKMGGDPAMMAPGMMAGDPAALAISPEHKEVLRGQGSTDPRRELLQVSQPGRG
jgi:hypothetical protein